MVSYKRFLMISDTRVPGGSMTRLIHFLTTEPMRELDRAMIEDYDIELIQMMDLAGPGTSDPNPWRPQGIHSS